jgi:hypothetical protein
MRNKDFACGNEGAATPAGLFQKRGILSARRRAADFAAQVTLLPFYQ